MIIRKSQLILRCFAQMDKDSSWFAMCVDLNLYARAGSLTEVQQQLDEIISEFVTEALTDDRDHAADLLSRRTPLVFWIRYYWFKILCQIFHGDKDGDDQTPSRHFPYSAPLPIAPA